MSIQQLFEQYQQGFDTLNALKIAQCYSLPCAMSDGDGQQVFSALPELIDKFHSNCEKLSQTGYSGSEFTIANQTSLDEHSQLVDIKWRVFLKDSHLDFKCLYICHKPKQTWHIFTAKVY